MEIEKLFKVGRTTAAIKKRFLAALADTGYIRQAAKVAGISPALHYWWLKRDPKYAEAMETVKEIQDSVIKGEIWDRAMVGAERPVMYKGQITCYYKEKSDELLKFEAKARMPEYRDGQQINIAASGPPTITFVSGRERPELICTQPAKQAPQLVDSTQVDKKQLPSK